MDLSSDVDMACLRRSERIANKASFKENSKLPVATHTLKKVQKRATTSNRCVASKKKVASMSMDKFRDIEQVKISDVFALVKKHETLAGRRAAKYAILKAVVQNIRSLNISNRVLDLNKHHHQISHMLVAYPIRCDGLHIQAILEHINEILAYPELWRLDLADEMEGTSIDLGYDDIVAMMDSVNLQAENARCNVDSLLKDIACLHM